MIKLTTMMHTTIQKMRNTYRHDGCSGGEEKMDTDGKEGPQRERGREVGCSKPLRQAGMETGM